MSDRSKARESYAIQSLIDGMRILEAISEAKGEIGISCLSSMLKLGKAKVFRVLATFQGLGYVEQVKDSRTYRLGLSAFTSGQKFLSGMGLLREVRPLMDTLAREFDEAVYCAVPVGEEVLFLDMVNTTQQVAIMSLVGKRYPLAQVAAGQVIQAFATGRGRAKRHLAVGALDQAHSIEGICDLGALGNGVASLAVPLFEAGGKVSGSLCLVAPEFRLDRPKIESVMLPRLRRAAETISARLGYLDQSLNSAYRLQS